MIIALGIGTAACCVALGCMLEARHWGWAIILWLGGSAGALCVLRMSGAI